MDELFKSYLDRLKNLHDEISLAIVNLPQEALDWTPGPKMNSIGVLVVHLTGAERYWIGDVARQEPSGRVREAEFRAYGLDHLALRGLLDRGLAYASNAVEKLSIKDLEILPNIDPHEGQVSIAWALLHALEQTAIHLGQIQLTRQLWEQRK